MKRAFQSEKVAQMRERFPYRNSPQSLTLESEIKRVAEERGEAIDLTIERLSEFSGIGVRQIYNYRSGKCDIPSSQIPIFCKEFGSNALAMSVLQQCEAAELLESYDIVRLANQSARHTLQVHDDFLAAFDDNVVDGFELTNLKKKKAKAVAHFNQLEQIAEAHYERQAA